MRCICIYIYIDINMFWYLRLSGVRAIWRAVSISVVVLDKDSFGTFITTMAVNELVVCLGLSPWLASLAALGKGGCKK